MDKQSELLYEKIYNDTQECGRAQFVKLLQRNEIKIRQLNEENFKLMEQLNEYTKQYENRLKESEKNTYETSQEIMGEMQQEIEELKQKINCIDKYIEEELWKFIDMRCDYLRVRSDLYQIYKDIIKKAE